MHSVRFPLSVAQVRYTVDTRDSFYEGEVQFWNETVPAIRLLMQKAEKVILESPFIKEFVLHRIYEMGTDTLLLMGDGNLSQMEVCSRDVVLGKAVKIIRKGHEVDCSSRMERFLSLTWMRLRPFRRGLLVVCRFILNGLDDKK